MYGKCPYNNAALAGVLRNYFASLASDKGLASLAKSLRKAEELNLQRLKHVSNNGLKSISCDSLTSLNLKHSDAITDPGLVALVRGCPNIEKLNVSELHKLTDVSLVVVAETLGRKLVSLIGATLLTSQKKTFKKNAKICRDDYAKKYSNKVYIGMAVSKGRGDDIKHKVKHT